MRISLQFLLLLLTVFGYGCGSLSGAGSMRIEVEVYKGPLSKEPDIQWAELRGLIKESRAVVLNAHETMCAFATLRENQGIFFPFCEFQQFEFDEFATVGNTIHNLQSIGKEVTEKNKSWGDAIVARATHWGKVVASGPSQGRSVSSACEVRSAASSSQTLGDTALDSCRIFAQIHDDALRLMTVLESIASKMSPPSNFAPLTRNVGCGPKRDKRCEHYREVMSEIGQLAMQLKANAQYWGYQLSMGNPRERSSRYLTAGFAHLTSELGNQFGSRADALLKQIEGDDKRFLPASVYLRDSQTTDFVNLPTWKRASPPPLWPDIFLRPIYAWTPEESVDRARVYERLYADNYWSNINTVFASGRGNVNMAFIKDDIGNWGLKQFDNDPSELLDAYKKAGKAIINGITNLATSGGAGVAAEATAKVAASTKMLDLADRLTTGRTKASGEGRTGVNLSALHERTHARLAAVGERVSKEKAELDDLKDKVAVQPNPTKDSVPKDVCPEEESSPEKRKKILDNLKLERAKLNSRIMDESEEDRIKDWAATPKAKAKKVREKVDETDPTSDEEQFIDKCKAWFVAKMAATNLAQELAYAAALQKWLATTPAMTREELKRILDEHDSTLDAVTEVILPPNSAVPSGATSNEAVGQAKQDASVAPRVQSGARLVKELSDKIPGK